MTTHIAPEDVFATIEITRGWLSNGVSVATTVNGGDGNDEFTVFHNIGTLNLNGGDGDDLFTVRAFALAGSTDSERGRTDMKGDAGADGADGGVDPLVIDDEEQRTVATGVITVEQRETQVAAGDRRCDAAHA